MPTYQITHASCKCGAKRLRCLDCGHNWCPVCKGDSCPSCVVKSISVEPVQVVDTLAVDAVEQQKALDDKRALEVVEAFDTLHKELLAAQDKAMLLESGEHRTTEVTCICGRKLDVTLSPSDVDWWLSEMHRRLFPSRFAIGDSVWCKAGAGRIMSIQTSMSETYTVQYLVSTSEGVVVLSEGDLTLNEGEWNERLGRIRRAEHGAEQRLGIRAGGGTDG